mmetsp:Transcript_9839/g.22483  ORF Transcript_9839/g.22483 Transcript_9839/m.22483 type:complete len:103 (+) Transcript_9839:623-931(+)
MMPTETSRWTAARGVRAQVTGRERTISLLFQLEIMLIYFVTLVSSLLSLLPFLSFSLSPHPWVLSTVTATTSSSNTDTCQARKARQKVHERSCGESKLVRMV